MTEAGIDVEVRRNARVSTGVAGVAALVATGYFARAASTGGLLDWVLCGALALVALVHVFLLLDARAPLLVADDFGMRVRRGRIWHGMPWSELGSVEHAPRRGLLRDGRLVLRPRSAEADLAVRLGLATRVVGADDLTAALVELAAGRTEVHERGASTDERDELMEPKPAERDIELTDTQVGHAPTMVIDEVAAVPAVDPEIGPELAAARRRLALDIDVLADRTRIQPHVIEAIEIDDFTPCGGDFYARGHLRTLARVLGVDVAPLLATYDAKYADAPIDPRCVFEAELATGGHGSIRGTRGGPNWSVLVAAVMAVVLAWSIARLVLDNPMSVTPAPPSLADGSAGLTSGGDLTAPVPVVLTAAGGGARVVLRDGGGRVVYTGPISFGESLTFQVSPPIRVQSTDGSLEVTVSGEDHGALGTTGQPAQDLFTGR